MTSNDLAPLNDGAATRVNRGSGGLSSPDLTVVHSSLLARAEWGPLESLGSDHLPILSELDLAVHVLSEEQPRLRWNWKKADWPAYSETLDQSVLKYRTRWDHDSLSENISFLTGAMIAAAHEHIGMVRAKRLGKEWMTPEVAEAIWVRNRLGRDIAEQRSEWIEACQHVRALTAEAKRKNWEEFVRTLEGHTQFIRAWGVIRSLSGKAPKPAERNRVLVHRGKEFRTDYGKADAFVNQYASVSRHTHSVANRNLERGVRQSLARASAMFGPVEASCADFSLSELDHALRLSNAASAEGADGVSARFLLGAGAAARNFFLSAATVPFRRGFVLSPGGMRSSCPS